MTEIARLKKRVDSLEKEVKALKDKEPKVFTISMDNVLTSLDDPQNLSR